MESTQSKITENYAKMNSIGIGREFSNRNNLQPGQQYSIRILDETAEEELEARGTLTKSYILGGLSILYRNYELTLGDEINVKYDESHILITPPAGKRRGTVAPVGSIPGNSMSDIDQQQVRSVFYRKGLKHIHIEPFAEKNFREWTPKTEADVYLVFGAISEFTDYKYCCGASTELLEKLGYNAETKPDAILIDRATDEYLVAEFKMKSSGFKSNHKKDDIDVLICWVDDEINKDFLPNVLCLSLLIEKSIKDGDIEI